MNFTVPAQELYTPMTNLSQWCLTQHYDFSYSFLWFFIAGTLSLIFSEVMFVYTGDKFSKTLQDNARLFALAMMLLGFMYFKYLQW